MAQTLLFPSFFLSYFARFELPNVPADKVSKFNVLVAEDIGKTPE